MSDERDALEVRIGACDICADRFASTKTAHTPRPVTWFDTVGRATGAEPPRILIAGQAPGARVHSSGKPFTDPSGDRLRAWMNVSEAQFYDRRRIAIVPMAFCFPGYTAKGSDLPPPPICAKTWRGEVMQALGAPRVTLLIGGYAMKWHLGRAASVAATVENWRDHAPFVFPLPHPSWRNTAWLKKRPWFAQDVLPELRRAIAEALE